MPNIGMVRAVLCMLVIAAVAPLAHAQGRGVMAVTTTVVNTCVFGQQARCLLRGTSLVSTEEGPATAIMGAPGADAAGAGATRRRVVHL